MRRVLLVTMLAGVVAGGPPAQATSSPQLHDDRGDWQVQSQDVVSGRLSTTAGKALVGELALAAPPAAGVETLYGFFFLSRCVQWGFAYRWAGAAEASEATFQRTDFCAGGTVPPVETFPVTFTAKGGTLSFRTPYVAGIRDGLTLDGFSATACSTICGAYVLTDDEVAGVATGDLGYSEVRYVVGSERRRR